LKATTHGIKKKSNSVYPTTKKNLKTKKRLMFTQYALF